MSLTNVRRVFALVLVSLVGAGLGLLSDASRGGDPPGAKGPGKAAEGGSRLADLLKKRRDAAREELAYRKQAFAAGREDGDKLLDASLRLLTAELDLAPDRAGRVAACEAHRKRATEVSGLFQARLKAGLISVGDAARAEFNRLDAEVRLERAKGR